MKQHGVLLAHSQKTEQTHHHHRYLRAVNASVGIFLLISYKYFLSFVINTELPEVIVFHMQSIKAIKKKKSN